MCKQLRRNHLFIRTSLVPPVLFPSVLEVVLICGDNVTLQTVKCFEVFVDSAVLL